MPLFPPPFVGLEQMHHVPAGTMPILTLDLRIASVRGGGC
jgi:hypothetical protein